MLDRGPIRHRRKLLNYRPSNYFYRLRLIFYRKEVLFGVPYLIRQEVRNLGQKREYISNEWQLRNFIL